MPVLKNPRWEMFAHNIAKGMGQAEAYEAAGYKTTRGAGAVSANRLLKDPNISSRVSEILERRERVEETSTIRAIEKTGLSKAWVMDNLREIYLRCMGDEEFSSAGANRALELIGKELGMFIDRSEAGKPGDFDKLSTDELRDIVAGRIGISGAGGSRAAAPGTGGNALGKPH
jgi:phage terminase small subunit